MGTEKKNKELDETTFLQLVEEGRKLRQEFDKKSAGMRNITPKEWKTLIR